MFLLCIASFAELHREYFAFRNVWGYMDGPREGAYATRGLRTFVDADSNVWMLNSIYYGNLRCITKNGRVITITGNDYWLSDNSITEGPASAMGPLNDRNYGFGFQGGYFIVLGVPLKGEAEGCIYGTTAKGELVKIWKNSQKNGRWWFKKVVGLGSTAWPLTHGGKLTGAGAAKSVVSIETGPYNEVLVFGGKSSARGVFRLDTATLELTCLLGVNDYKPRIPTASNGDTVNPSECFVDADHNYYLGYYYNGVPAGVVGCGGAIYRVSMNLDTVSLFVRSNVQRSDYDGAVTTVGFFCGPHMRPNRNNAYCLPANIITPSCHDEAMLRRVMDGRVSTLCKDGEWRESPVSSLVMLWTHFDFCAGPNGTGYSGYLSPDNWGDFRMYKIGGIDWAKPTLK